MYCYYYCVVLLNKKTITTQKYKNTKTTHKNNYKFAWDMMKYFDPIYICGKKNSDPTHITYRWCKASILELHCITQ